MTALPATFVSLHPTRDVILRVPGFSPGGVTRADGWLTYPGGKALNGARTAGILGGRPKAMLLAPSGWRAWLREILAFHRVAWRMWPIAGDGRICVILSEGRRETVINTDLAVTVPPAIFTDLAGGIRRAAARPGFVVFAGSLPPSLGVPRARTLLALAGAGRARLVLDQTGRWLRLGLRFRPWLIKPNLREFHQLIGRTTSSMAQAIAAAERLRTEAVGRVLLSLGARGCLLVSAAGRWLAEAVRLPVGALESPVGCGDALLGAFLQQVGAGAGEPDALAWGVAAATANLAHAGAVQFTAAEVRAIRPRVRVARV